MLELVLIVALVVLVFFGGTAFAILVLRLSSRFGPDFPSLVGLLVAVSLTASAAIGLRSEPSPSEWMLLVVAVISIIAHVIAIVARRYRPDLLYRRSSPPPPERVAELDARLRRRDELRALISGGQTIRAIKLYKDDTGATLSEAKGIIDSMPPGRPESV